MQLPRSLARFNRRFANPVQSVWSGVLPPWAILTHVGRKSGKHYRIPIVAWKSEDRIAIALLYGPNSDWVRNVLASGSTTMRRAGKELTLTNARRVESNDLAGLGFSRLVALICRAAEHTMLFDIAR